MKLGSVMIGSENPDKLAIFYTKLIGEPAWNDGSWYGFDGDGSYLMIGPHSEVKGESREPQRIILNFISNDVRTDFTKAKELGAKVVAEPYQPDKDGSPAMWIATFMDPDGNYFQFSTPWKT
jgi:predicted enzyme related to lactoylglutathione lyase